MVVAILAVVFPLVMLWGGIAGYGIYIVGRIQHLERKDARWDQAFEHERRGHILERQRQYGRAIAEYRLAAQLNPEPLSPLQDIARVYRKQGRTDDAITEYRAVIALEPRLDDPEATAWAHYELGNLLLSKGDTEAARAEWKLALTHAPIDRAQQAAIYKVHAEAQKALNRHLSGGANARKRAN